MADQDFQLKEGPGGLPGEYVCAGASCGAVMIMGDPAGDSPTGTLTMHHADGCEEVKRLTGTGA